MGNHCDSIHAPATSGSCVTVPSLQIDPDAITPRIKRKRGRPRKEDRPRPTAPVPSEPASPIPSSQIKSGPTTPIKRRRGRPQKGELLASPAKFPNSASLPASQRDSGAALSPSPIASATHPRFRCRLDVLHGQQRSLSDADEASPRRARVLHLPLHRPSLEPADPVQKRLKRSSSLTTTTNRSLSLEDQSGSQTNYSEHDDEAVNRFKSGFQNSRHPSPSNPVQVLGDSTFSVASTRRTIEENRGQESPLRPAASIGSDNYAGSPHLLDSYDSKQCLIYCGLADDFSATICEEWKSRGTPGTLGSHALNKIKETATNRGFNPWACSEIVIGRFWNRRGSPANTQEHHVTLVENVLPDGKRKWEWERDWTTSLREMGLAQSLIDTVGQSLYADMRASTPVSHWAYNFVQRKWNELTDFNNKINATLSRRNLDAEESEIQEEERQREERAQELFDLQQWASRNPESPETGEVEGSRISELVRPRSPIAINNFDLFNVTRDEDGAPLDWMDHAFEDYFAAYARQ